MRDHQGILTYFGAASNRVPSGIRRCQAGLIISERGGAPLYSRPAAIGDALYLATAKRLYSSQQNIVLAKRPRSIARRKPLTRRRSVINRAPNSSAPIVLPVVFNGTSAELAAVKKQYQHFLKAPTKNQSFLDAIDDALALKPPAAGKAEDNSGR